jgi:hypothetical protein
LALGTGLILFGAGTLSIASAQTEATDDPLVMFAELMPVFTSPRCVNCHGGTDPSVPRNHPGGRQDVPVDQPGGDMSLETGRNEECLNCHDVAPDDFRLAPKHMSFVGLDTPMPLCRHFRTDPFNPPLRIPENRETFLAHLTHDALIGMAFIGRGGVGEESAFANEVTVDPPPMSRQEFLAKAARWLNDGEGACSNKWNGTITETTFAAESVTFAPAPGGRKVDSEIKIVITVVESEATAAVHWTFHDFTDVPLKECLTHLYLTSTADSPGVPVTLEIVIPREQIALPPGGFPGLPPGLELPPGMELPPGFEFPTELFPPGMELPAGVSGVTGPFFMYQSTDKSEIAGNDRIDTLSMPGCKHTVTDTAHPFHIGGGMIEFKIDPENPNHVVGEKVIDDPARKSKTTIKWDLVRDRE